MMVISFLIVQVNAQTTTSTIEGTITDANGAGISGATIKVVSNTLASERTVVANENGFYRIPALLAGNYTLTVTQAGFSPASTKFELTLNRTATVNIRLEVGEVSGGVVVGFCRHTSN